MPEKQCFVVMPFAEHFSDHYHGIYVPAIQAAGLVPKRADSDPGPEPFLEAICRGIEAAEVVVADMSERNPNVMYEIGYAHGRDKPVVLLAQKEEDVPSDIHHIRVEIYKQGRQGWREELTRNLTEVLKRVIETPDRYRLRATAPGLGPHRIGDTVTIRERIGGFSDAAISRANAAAELLARQTRGTREDQVAARAFIHVRRALHSQVKQLQALMKKHFETEIGWKGIGEEYDVWWSAGRAPDVAKVAEFAEMLGMEVSLEGYSA